MVNKNKTHRLMVQVTVNQYNWLVKKAASLDLSISQLVRWLLNKKIKDINDIKNLETKPKETMQKLSEEEWNQMLNELDNAKMPPNLIADLNDLPF